MVVVKLNCLNQWMIFNKDRKDVRTLIGGNGQTEHCALIKNIETLLNRPNKMNHRCKYWFNSQINSQIDNHICSHSLKPEIVCPKKKHFTFLNERKRKNKKHIITPDIECCIVDVTTNSSQYVISDNIPISVGYIWQGNFKYYFGIDCIERFARDLSEIETENNFKLDEEVIFTEEDN